jgi:hypothetical protein
MCLLGPGTFCMEHARRKYLRRHARLRTDVNDALIGLYGWNKGWFSSWSADFATTPPFPHNFPFSLFRCAVRFWVSLQFGLVKSTNAYSFGTSKTWIHINVSYTRVYHINVFFYYFWVVTLPCIGTLSTTSWRWGFKIDTETHAVPSIPSKWSCRSVLDYKRVISIILWQRESMSSKSTRNSPPKSLQNFFNHFHSLISDSKSDAVTAGSTITVEGVHMKKGEPRYARLSLEPPTWARATLFNALKYAVNAAADCAMNHSFRCVAAE